MIKLSLKLGLIVLFFFPMLVAAQMTKQVKPLKVGDKMPNLSFADIGDVRYNTTGNTKFSEFKGKLIILDFWSTHCDACIIGIPKLEKLQQEFKDSIQVILVNADQTQQEISLQLKNMKANPFPYNLTQVVNAKLLRQLFPYQFAGNQIWIDGDGVIRLNGSFINMHAQKIREVLAGRPITYLSMGKLNAVGKDIASLSLLYDKHSKFLPMQQSSIFPLNEVVGTASSGTSLVDSANKTRTDRYLNITLLDLYNLALFRNIADSWANEIAFPSRLNYINKYILSVADTLRYTDCFVERRDIEWRRSRYCYEQIGSMGLSQAKREEYMFQDLQRYFENIYGTKVKIENRDQPCYLLVKTSSFNLNQLKSTSKSMQVTGRLQFQKDGKKMIRYQNLRLSSIMQNYCNILFQQNIKQPFLDETKCSENLDLVLPDQSEIKSLEGLKAALHLYGLDIIEAPRKLKMIIFEDNTTSRKQLKY